MELEGKHKLIIDKLNSGLKFGMFEKGLKCYFQDGTHVSYSDLWKAVRELNQLSDTEKKTLAQICPNSYVGVHDYSYKKHNWKKDSHAA